MTKLFFVMKNYKTIFKTFNLALLSLVFFQCNDVKTKTAAKGETASDKNTTSSGKTLMAIFAHPDDELTVAPLLVKYVEEGVKVYLVIATDGRFGTNDGEYEAGDALAAMRRKEMKCSADNLGVELIHLTYEDQLKSSEGYDGHIPHVRSLIKEVHDIVEKIKPDAIITFGPEGWSNHMDHRLVGATVTQVFVSKIWNKPMNLLYVGTPTDSLDDPEKKIIRGQDRSYLTTRVSYTKAHRETAYKALSCHISQFGEGGLEKMRKRNDKKEKTVYMRKFVAPTENETTIL